MVVIMCGICFFPVAVLVQLQARASFRTPGFGWGFCCAGANTTQTKPDICYLVTVATKPMNVLSLIQKQQQKKQALQTAQNAIAKTANLCYRGVCYTR